MEEVVLKSPVPRLDVFGGGAGGERVLLEVLAQDAPCSRLIKCFVSNLTSFYFRLHFHSELDGVISALREDVQ